MIATDNHLGYCEKDALRSNDSFDTFEEILQLARSHDVDCMLLGGDVFHENRPSRRTLHRTLEMLRHYCMGNKPCALELLSDPSVNFPSKFGTVNYEDPNYNVALPIFAIHGNHDDPTGDGNLSSIDLLSTAGLLNYFGKTATVDDITITPVLLRKGTTKFALYGLGAVRDERLYRTFLQHKVKFLRPPEADTWFNMMILHQNRVAHGPTSYIPETFLEDFLDLVVWGHEHECQACDPTSCPQKSFTVCQPGSSVATSLSEGETKGKHVVILEVTGRQMNIVPVPLTSVRPFMMRDVILREVRPPLNAQDTKQISIYLAGQVTELIGIAEREWNVKQALIRDAELRKPFPLPLIRLRVDYSASSDADPATTNAPAAYAIMNPQRFGQQFVNRIANPRDVVSFIRRRAPTATRRRDPNTAAEASSPTVEGGKGEAMRVEDLVSQFLANQKLDLFPQNEFNDIVRVSVEKDDRDAIESFVKQFIDKTLMTVKPGILEKELLKGEFEKSRKLREDEWGRLHRGVEDLLITNRSAFMGGKANDSDETASEDEGERRLSHRKEPVTPKPTTSTPTSARGRGRGARGGINTTPRASPAKRPGPSKEVFQSKVAKPIALEPICIDSDPIEVNDDDADTGKADAENIPLTTLTNGRQLESTPTSRWG